MVGKLMVHLFSSCVRVGGGTVSNPGLGFYVRLTSKKVETN